MIKPIISSTIAYLFTSIPFQILNFLGNILLARMLLPEYFGTIALALVFREWLSILIGWSTSQYFVLGDGSQQEFENNFLGATLAGVLIIIVGVALYLLAHNNENQVFYLIVMIVCFSEGITCVAQLLLAPLERNLELLKLSILRNGSVTISMVLAVLVAYISPGIWPLVFRELLLSLLLLLAGIWTCNYKIRVNFSSFSKNGLKLVKYGYSLNLSRATEVIFYRIPDLLFAKIFGVAETGHFTQARTFIMFTLKIPNTVLEQVLFLSLVKLKSEKKSAEYFYFMQFLTSRLMIVAAWYFALLAPPIFIWLFGENWRTASFLLPHLSGFMFFAALFNALQAYYYSLENQLLVTLSYGLGIFSFIGFVFVLGSASGISEIASALTYSMGISCLALHFLGLIQGFKIPIFRVFWLPSLTMITFLSRGLSIDFQDYEFILFLIIILTVSVFEVIIACRKILENSHNQSLR